MSYKRVSVSEAKSIIESGNSQCLDMRHIEDYNEEHDLQFEHLSQNRLLEILSSTPKSTPMLLMCYHGNSSQMAAQFLTEKGFTEVYSIDGGYEEWKESL